MYSANFAPEPTGIGKYSGEMAAFFASQGHQVRVVTAPPYYPDWKVTKQYAWPPYQRCDWQDVDVWRAPIWVPAHPSGLARLLHLFTFALSSLPIMLMQILWRPDAVMTVAPALMCAPTGLLVAKLTGAKSWLHIQDFEVDVAFEMQLLKGKLFERCVRHAEKWLFKRFDVVSTISKRMLDKLRVKSVDEQRLKLFPNWVDTNHIYPLSAPSAYRDECAIEPTIKVALFSGTLGNKQGLHIIPKVAKKLAHRKDLLFIICGDGVMKAQLKKSSSALSNVKFMPLQPFDRLGQLLGLADIHLLPQNPEATDLVLPSKLSGMLASGKAIIATCNQNTEIASVVNQCGIVVQPDDALALADAIELLLDNEQMRLNLGKAARIYCENNLACHSVLGRMQEHFLTLTQKSAPQLVSKTSVSESSVTNLPVNKYNLLKTKNINL